MTGSMTARRKWQFAVAGVLVLAVAFGLWGLWRVWAPAADDVGAQLANSERQRTALGKQVAELRQRVTTLSRSDQISRDANRDLQNTLAERDEQIAGLRADVAFYERLVGPTAQRNGLSVHALRLQPQNDTAWHFTSTLTQNLNRGAVSSGDLTLSVEGTYDGRRQTLAWNELRQQIDADSVDYSFKYFQEIEGDIFLPDGFSPVRVTVQLQPESGAAVEESFSWAKAANGET